MNMAARKQLTAQLAKKVCALVIEGNFPTTAALVCGVSKGQHEYWVKLGRETQTQLDLDERSGVEASTFTDHALKCAAYVEAIEHAEAELENVMIAKYRAHAVVAPDSVAGIPKFVSSRFKHWRDEKRTTIAGDEDRPITLVIETVQTEPKPSDPE